MTYERVPRDPNVELTAGTYELVTAVDSGDPGKVDRLSLQRALRLRHGRHIDVLDYGRKNGQLLIRFRVNPHNTSLARSAETGVISTQALWLPTAISAATIIAVLLLMWRISVHLVEFVELVISSPAAQVAFGGLGLGALLLGAAALAWVVWPREGYGSG